jgi:5-methylcytosine-specific restriction endonuclease McrA
MARKRSRTKPHRKTCEQCRRSFCTGRQRQKTCSNKCRTASRQTRFSAVCANASCGKEFTVTPSQYAKGRRCCSWQCRAEHMRLPDRFCQNPVCGKKIEREAQGPRKTALGQDGRKYCCRECAWDHRWGSDRPRKNWSKQHLAAASAGALQTSLRKKCKILEVPFDEQCTRRAVLERDGWVCQLCEIKCNREYVIDPRTRKPDPQNAEHDHIIAITTPGSLGNVFPNSQCLCRKCNNKKRDRSIGQLRLDLEGSVKRWESGARGRRQQNLSFSVATQATGQSTEASRSRPQMAL